MDNLERPLVLPRRGVRGARVGHLHVRWRERRDCRNRCHRRRRHRHRWQPVSQPRRVHHRLHRCRIRCGLRQLVWQWRLRHGHRHRLVHRRMHRLRVHRVVNRRVRGLWLQHQESRRMSSTSLACEAGGSCFMRRGGSSLHHPGRGHHCRRGRAHGVQAIWPFLAVCCRRTPTHSYDDQPDVRKVRPLGCDHDLTDWSGTRGNTSFRSRVTSYRIKHGRRA